MWQSLVSVGGNMWQELNHLHYVVNAADRIGNNAANILLHRTYNFIINKTDGVE
jgi:hypothetical protein